MKVVVALYGITGSGKLDLAVRLQRLLGFDIHRADLVRAEDFSSWEAAAAERGAFERMILGAWHSLKAERSVCLSGCTFARSDARVAARELARRAGADYIPIWCDSSPEAASARIAATRSTLREEKDLLAPFFEDVEFHPVTEHGVLRIPEGTSPDRAARIAYARIRRYDRRAA